MSRFSANYKQTGPTTRFMAGENTFEKGMLFSDSVLTNGYVRTLLNLEIDSSNYTLNVTGGLKVKTICSGSDFIDNFIFGDSDSSRITVINNRNKYCLEDYEGVNNIINVQKVAVPNNQNLKEELVKLGYKASEVICYKLLIYNPINNRLLSVTMLELDRDEHFEVSKDFKLRRLQCNPISLGNSEKWENYVSNKDRDNDFYLPCVRRNLFSNTFGKKLHSPHRMQTVAHCEGFGNKTLLFTKNEVYTVRDEFNGKNTNPYIYNSNVGCEPNFNYKGLDFSESLEKIRYGKIGCSNLLIPEESYKLSYRRAANTVNVEWLVEGFSILNIWTFGGVLEIPESYLGKPIIGIHTSAFENKAFIKKVIINSRYLKYIGAFAFRGCVNLKEIICYNNNEVAVGTQAFSSCINLRSITFKGSVKLETSSFMACPKLRYMRYYGEASKGDSYTIFTRLKSVCIISKQGADFFKAIVPTTCAIKMLNPDDYNSIEIVPDKYISVNDNKLYFCLEQDEFTFKLPSHLIYIDDNAFEGCPMTSINLGSGEEHYTTNTKTEATLLYIGNSAFKNCTELTNLFIPRTVTHLGMLLFEGCSALVSVFFQQVNEWEKSVWSRSGGPGFVTELRTNYKLNFIDTDKMRIWDRDSDSFNKTQVSFTCFNKNTISDSFEYKSVEGKNIFLSELPVMIKGGAQTVEWYTLINGVEQNVKDGFSIDSTGTPIELYPSYTWVDGVADTNLDRLKPIGFTPKIKVNLNNGNLIFPQTNYVWRDADLLRSVGVPTTPTDFLRDTEGVSGEYNPMQLTSIRAFDLKIGTSFKFAVYAQSAAYYTKAFKNTDDLTKTLEDRYRKTLPTAVWVLDYKWNGSSWDFNFRDVDEDYSNELKVTKVEGKYMDYFIESSSTEITTLGYLDLITENNVNKTSLHTVDFMTDKTKYYKEGVLNQSENKYDLRYSLTKPLAEGTDVENKSKLFDAAYGYFNIEPKKLTPGEAVLWGYNMLATNPYLFECLDVSGFKPEITGVLLTDKGKPLLKPVQNTAGILNIYFNADSSNLDSEVSYQLKVEYKNLYGEWSSLKDFSKEETMQGLKKFTPFQVKFTGSDENVLIRVEILDLNSNVSVPDDKGVIHEKYLVISTLNTALSYTQDVNQSEVKPETYVLSTATGTVYWKNRLVLWGVEQALNVLFMSEINQPEYFPYPNNIDVFEENIVHAIVYGDSLVVFTTTKLWRIDLQPDGLSWNKVLLQQNFRLTNNDIPYICVVKNMLFFKSGPEFYMLVPSRGSVAGELTIAPISRSISNFLKKPFTHIKELLNIEDKKIPFEEYLVKYGVHVEQLRVYVDWWFDIYDFEEGKAHISNVEAEHDQKKNKQYLLVQLIYDTQRYSWSIDTHTVNSVGMFISDAANVNTEYLSLFEYKGYDSTSTLGLQISERKSISDILYHSVETPTLTGFKPVESGYDLGQYGGFSIGLETFGDDAINEFFPSTPYYIVGNNVVMPGTNVGDHVLLKVNGEYRDINYLIANKFIDAAGAVQNYQYVKQVVIYNGNLCFYNPSITSLRSITTGIKLKKGFYFTYNTKQIVPLAYDYEFTRTQGQPWKATKNPIIRNTKLVVETVEPYVKRTQIMDTGYKEVSNPSLTKKFREIQLFIEPKEGDETTFEADKDYINSDSLQEAIADVAGDSYESLQGYMEAVPGDVIVGNSRSFSSTIDVFVDGNLIKASKHPKIITELADDNEYIIKVTDVYDLISGPFTVDAELSNTFTLNDSALEGIKLVRYKKKINGKGQLIRMKFTNYTETNYTISGYSFVANNKNAR